MKITPRRPASGLRTGDRRAGALLAGAVWLAGVSGAFASGHAPKPPAVATTPGFAIKPSEVVPPEGVPPGQYRRIVRPFPNWTLICDENLEARRRVCNIAQIVTAADGGTAFSWSLAASRTGRPFMILRVPAGVGAAGEIRIDFRDGTKPLAVRTARCAGDICIAYAAVGPYLKTHILKASAPEISYALAAADGSLRRVAFVTPLEGLAAALAAI